MIIFQVIPQKFFKKDNLQNISVESSLPQNTSKKNKTLTNFIIIAFVNYLFPFSKSFSNASASLCQILLARYNKKSLIGSQELAKCTNYSVVIEQSQVSRASVQVDLRPLISKICNVTIQLLLSSDHCQAHGV